VAIKYNFVIDQGSDFDYTIVLNDQNDEPFNVSGFTANAQMRSNYTASNSIPFTTTLANGSLTLALAGSVSANIEAKRYVYDVMLSNVNDGIEERILEGIATVSPRVTREG